MPLFLSPTTGLSEEGEDMYLYSQHSAWATWEATPRQGSASKNNKLKGGGGHRRTKPDLRLSYHGPPDGERLPSLWAYGGGGVS